MRKIFSLTAILLCVAFLTVPFSAAPSAVSLVEGAVGKMDDIQSIDYKVIEKQILTVGGEKSDYSRSLGIQAVYKGRNSADLSIQATDSLGEKVNIYYKDGYVYQNIYGMKARQKAGSMPADPLDHFMLLLPRESFRNAEVTPTESGYKVVAVIPSEFVTEYAKDSLTERIEEEGYKNVRVAFSNFRVTYRIDAKGNLQAVSSTYIAAVSSDKGKLSIQYSQACVIHSVNQISSINFPADLSSYTTY